MASLLNIDVEIVRLARLVDAGAGDLDYLRDCDPRTSATCASRWRS